MLYAQSIDTSAANTVTFARAGHELPLIARLDQEVSGIYIDHRVRRLLKACRSAWCPTRCSPLVIAPIAPSAFRPR